MNQPYRNTSKQASLTRSVTNHSFMLINANHHFFFGAPFICKYWMIANKNLIIYAKWISFVYLHDSHQFWLVVLCLMPQRIYHM